MPVQEAHPNYLMNILTQWNQYLKQLSIKESKRSYTQLDSRKQVIAFLERVTTIHKEDQHPTGQHTHGQMKKRDTLLLRGDSDILSLFQRVCGNVSSDDNYKTPWRKSSMDNSYNQMVLLNAICYFQMFHKNPCHLKSDQTHSVMLPN